MLNIRWITRKGFDHAAFGFMFKYLSRGLSTVRTQKTMVDPNIREVVCSREIHWSIKINRCELKNKLHRKASHLK